MKKLKIILVNYRFFISGGPERYMFNIINLLEINGHEVIPFSVQSKLNHPNKYEQYFLSPLGEGDEVYANEYKKNNFTTLRKALARMLYSFEAKSKFKKLIKDTNPDLIYILHFQNKISTSIIDVAYKLNIPLVQRISDFGHMCVNNVFYRYDINTICEACLTGSKLNAVRYKCVQNSRVNSLIKVLALKIQQFTHTTDKIEAFVIPSKVTVSKFVQFGISPQKINHIPTFFSAGTKKNLICEYNLFALYIGRIVPDKGLMTLVKAFASTPYKLYIIGFSSDGYDDILKEYLQDKSHNIHFLGKLSFKDIEVYLQTCLFTVCPSEWYDNFPNSVLESFAFSKCVVASNLGSLQEMVTNDYNGLHFKEKDFMHLRDKVKYLFENRDEAIRMGANAKQKLDVEYSESLHLDKLLYVFNGVLTKRGTN